MAISTNGVVLTRLAGALYNQQLSNATYAEVLAAFNSPTALNTLANYLISTDFASKTDLQIATTLVTNLSLSNVTGLSNWIAAQLTAAGTAKGAKIISMLNDFSNMDSADATYGTAITAFNAKVDAAQVLSQTTGNTGSTFTAAGSSTTTFTLTTGVDLFTGTSGTDNFNAVLGTGATLNTFDSINAGAGTDTLSLVDSTAAAFSVPGSTTIAGFETVNLSRNAVAGATSIGVTITDTTFGTGVKTMNVVEAGLATTAAAASVTLNSATAISVISTGATKFNGVTIVDTGASATTAGSTLTTATIQGGSTTANAIWGNSVTTVNLNDTAAVATVVNAAAATRAVTVNTTGTAAIGGFADATATTLNINNAAAVALGTFTAASATTVNYTATAADTSMTLTAAKATTLNVIGSGSTVAKSLTTMTMTGNTVLATVNVTGNAGLVTDLTAGATAVTLLDTTGTTGKSTVTLNTATAVNGGSGADFITVAATSKAISLGAGDDQATVSVTALASGGSITGGEGADTLVLANADAVTLSTAGTTQTAWKAAVSGFETLNIGTQSGSTVNVTGQQTAAFTTVKMTSAAAAQILAGVTSGQTIESVYGAAATSVTTNSLSGAADSLTVKLSGDLSTAARVYGTFATPGIETVNFVTADTTTTVVGRQATATLTDTSAQSIVISGNNGLNLTHSGTTLYNFDASGVTKGGVSFSSAALVTDATVKGSTVGGDYLNFAAATSKVAMTTTAGANTVAGSSTLVNTITGGSGVDTIFGGAAADVINGGAGNDLIFADAITAAGEIQTITFASNAGGAAGDTVTIGGVATTIGTVNAANTTAAVVANAAAIIAANPSIATIADTAGTTVITYKPFTGNVALQTVTVTGAAVISNVETTAGIVPGATGTGAAHAAADVLTGGAGNDTFYFTAGGAVTAAATITDLNLGTNLVGGQVDTINIDGATTSAGTAVVVVTLSAAQQTNVSAAASLAAAVDAVLAIAATVNNVAQFTYGTDTYLIHNGATANAAFTAGEDTLIKITGVAGTIDLSDITIV
jgi:S-layer protein